MLWVGVQQELPNQRISIWGSGDKKTPKSTVVNCCEFGTVHLFFFFFAKLTFLISFLSLHHTHKFGFAAGVIPHTRWSPVVPNVLGMIGKCESPIRDLEQMWASSEKSSGAFFWDRTRLRTWLFVRPCKVLSLRRTRLSAVGPLNTWESTRKPHSGRQ